MKIICKPSPNFNERLSAIDTLIIHYTDMETAQEALNWLTNPISQVSAHYLIDEAGHVYHMVEEDKRAWHAGDSYWQGQTDINSCSIGIELANPGHSYGHTPFPEAQIHSLISLSCDIQRRWAIPTARILGHSDVAPRRKQDPGHLFPWERLAKQGLGLWPQKTDVSCPDLAQGLAGIGYETLSLSQALLAFQQHFQPHKCDGVADEETLRLVQGLLEAQKKLI